MFSENILFYWEFRKVTLSFSRLKCSFERHLRALPLSGQILTVLGRWHFPEWKLFWTKNPGCGQKGRKLVIFGNDI
jgi:hypothetical protein